MKRTSILSHFMLLLTFFAITGCESCDDNPDGPTPKLLLTESDFYVDCIKVQSGAIGSAFGALHLKGRIKNLSDFRVELRGSYKGSDNEIYEFFTDRYNNFRPIEKIYLDAGEDIYGSIIYIKEQPYIGVPATMVAQTGGGLFRVDAYPVDENDERVANGNPRKFIAGVPKPEGFIADGFGKYQCPCISYSDCGEQTQPVRDHHW